MLFRSGIQPEMDVVKLEQYNRNKPAYSQMKQRYRIVANAQFFHAGYMVATGLTKDEAEALIKML